MEKIINITIYRIRLQIHTNDEWVAEYFKNDNFSKHILPEYTYDYDCGNNYKSNVILYLYNNSKKGKIICENNIFYAYYKNIHSDIRHLSYLLLYVIQRSLQERNCYYMHSASLCINKKGFILAGDSGAGKTSIMLKGKSLKVTSIIGDDASIIGKDRDKFIVASGNRTLFYNEKYDDSFCYDKRNRKFFKDIECSNVDVEIDKLIFLIPYCENKCVVDLNHSRRILYEQLSFDIAGLGYYYLPDLIVYPNMDNVIFAQNRLKFVDDFLNSVKVYEVYGDYEYRENTCFKLFVD